MGLVSWRREDALRSSGVIIGLLVLCVACSSSTETGDSQTDEKPNLTRTVAKALIEEVLRESDLSTRTPSLRPDLPCIEMSNVINVNDAGEATLSPEVVGYLKSVVHDDDGFHIEYANPFEWEVTIENLWELSPGVVEISYTADVVNPPVHLALWFEACAAESGTEKMMLKDEGTRNAELGDDGEWKLERSPSP